MPALLAFNVRRSITIFLSSLITFLITCYMFIAALHAGSGLVSSIGGVTFIQGATQFWVTMARPTFSGITTAGAAVSGTVGSQSISAAADGSGNWSWTPSSDLSGDNAVTVTSGSTTVTFTLTIGQLPANIATSSAGALAPAGTMGPTAAFIIGGSVLLFIGGRGFARSFSKFN